MGQRLLTSLEDTREKLEHSTAKGDLHEAVFRQFLREHVGPKYRVGRGEVIDHHGRRSKETDVVVADEEQPFRVDDSPQLMIIEGVAAAAEVKTKLTTTELRDCLEKGSHFKALEAVLGKASMLASPEVRGTPNSDLLRFYSRRPFFVFAYEGAIADETLLDMISRVNDSERTKVPPLDAVFILNKGFAINLWDGNGALSFYSFTANDMVRGWQWFNHAHLVLVWLLFWLHGAMPRFGVRSSPLLAYLLPGTSWTPTPIQPSTRPL